MGESRRKTDAQELTPASRSWAQHAGYDLFRVFARLFGSALYRVRWEGAENYPSEGGGLICANHQSYFDPVLVGLTCNRRMNYLARDTLFKSLILGPAIRFLDAIPIDRDGGGLAGLKETLKRLKRGELVLIFPEGSRSRDGELSPLKPGFCAVARRSRTPLIPVAVDGAYQSWPRTARLPTLGRIAVVVGQPILPEEIALLSDEALVAELARRIATAHARARTIRCG